VARDVEQIEALFSLKRLKEFAQHAGVELPVGPLMKRQVVQYLIGDCGIAADEIWEYFEHKAEMRTK